MPGPVLLLKKPLFTKRLFNAQKCRRCYLYPVAFLFYIDPGSSGLLTQVIIGAVLAVGVFFRSARARIGDFFQRRKKADEPPAP